MYILISKIFHYIRYRFLLFAGLLPYCLGGAIAFGRVGSFDVQLFLVGLAGLFFVLVGVEAFNEYFDWILGTDRVFQLDPKPITKRKFYIGVAAFAVALIFAVHLTMTVGLGILGFAVFGFIAAAGYLGPPVKFTYRGLGEAVIALSYGPAMVLGSYYLQTRRIDSEPLIVSAIPALFLFCIAIMNEVPDFLQDGLVGKRNICVRAGPKNVVTIYIAATAVTFAAAFIMLLAGVLPPLGYLVFLLIPLLIYNYRTARANFESPVNFIPAVRGTIISYVITLAILIFAFIA